MSRRALFSFALAVALAGCGGGGGSGGAPQTVTTVRTAALAPNQGVQGALSAESPSLVALDPEATDGSHFQAYEITLPTAGTLTLLMKSKALDSHLQLFDGSFLKDPTDDTAFIAAGDDVGTTLDAMISEKLPAGTYVVLAGSAFENADEGAYTLTSTFTR